MYRWREVEPSKFCLWVRAKGGTYYKLSHFDTFKEALDEALQRCALKKVDHKLSYGDANTLLEIKWMGKMPGLVSSTRLSDEQIVTVRMSLESFFSVPKAEEPLPVLPPSEVQADCKSCSKGDFKGLRKHP